KPKERKAAVDVQLTKGMTVRVEGYGQTGILLEEPKGKTAQVQIGPLKMNVPVTSLTQVAPTREQQRSPRPNIGLQKAQTAYTEIHLRAMRAEDAMRDLEKFVDDAVLAGIPSV